MGHFAAMMTERNNRVGCAVATYLKPGEQYTSYVVACNFATSILIDSTIYTACDTPAMKCKSGKNSKYTSLCSTSEKYDFSRFTMFDDVE